VLIVACNLRIFKKFSAETENMREFSLKFICCGSSSVKIATIRKMPRANIARSGEIWRRSVNTSGTTELDQHIFSLHSGYTERR